MRLKASSSTTHELEKIKLNLVAIKKGEARKLPSTSHQRERA